MARTKRSLNNEEKLSIKAWSGKSDSQSSVVEVTIVIPGGGAPVTGESTSGWYIRL